MKRTIGAVVAFAVLLFLTGVLGGIVSAAFRSEEARSATFAVGFVVAAGVGIAGLAVPRVLRRLTGAVVIFVALLSLALVVGGLLSPAFPGDQARNVTFGVGIVVAVVVAGGYLLAPALGRRGWRREGP